MDEYNETVLVLLSNSIGATIEEGAMGVVTIDDDDPEPELHVLSSEAFEDEGFITFTMTLTSASEKEVSFLLEVGCWWIGDCAQSTDFGPVPLNGYEVVMPAGHASFDFDVPLAVDGFHEHTEYISPMPHQVQNAYYSSYWWSESVGTIYDDDPLLANDDYYETGRTSQISGGPNVGHYPLSNDSYPQGTVVLVTDVLHGSLTLDEDGSFVYVPNGSFQGIDSFVYSLSHGGEIDEASVSIQVGYVPVISDDDYEMDPLVTPTLTKNAAEGVLANDVDGDEDELTVSLDTSYQPRGGEVTLNSDGSFTFTPSETFHGVASFRYIASDGVSEDTGMAYIAVAAR